MKSRKTKFGKLRIGAPLLAVFLLVVACERPEQVGESIEERAQARWDLLVERDFGEAWQFYTPGFRETTPREIFAFDMNRRPLRWIEAQVLGADCEEDRCTVQARVSYRAVGAPMGQSRMIITRDIREDWIRLDGRWWYVTN